ncbi:hypothetical protein LSAT2_029225 [Lamellibrachia satsuma]|nr:hypothetical protein LSAT2_029225 [Lamellibrachia satsuma]
MRSIPMRDTLSRMRELRQEKRPLFFCKLIVTYPLTALALTLSFHIGFIATTGILFAVGYDIVPMHFSSLPLDIRTDEDYLQGRVKKKKAEVVRTMRVEGLAWAYKTEKTYLVNRLVDHNSRQAERTTRAEAVELYFEELGGNVFSRDNLLKIREVIYQFSRNAEYLDSLCYMAAGKCVEPYSVVYMCDEFEARLTGRNESDFTNVPFVLNTIQSMAPGELQMFLGKDSVITATTASSSITRAILFFGKPLAGYKNTFDRSDAQDTTIRDFILSDFKPLMEKTFEARPGGMDFYYNSLSLFLNKIDTQVMADLKLALGSLCFIFVFMLIQTGSLWVTCLALFSIVTSFCGANLFYRVVLDYRYFGAFHVLAVFIILAVGADDTFVFFDTWKLSSYFTYPTLAHRLSNCYRKAGLAMFFTSITTAVAFGLSAFSPFLGISSFGIFSALLVCINYVSVVTYFPAVAVTYHLYWETATCLCCCRVKDEDANNKDDNDEDEDDDIFSEKAYLSDHPAMRFFRGPFFAFITNRYSRVAIIAAFLVLIPFSLYFASMLKVDEEKMKFLDRKSNFGAYLERREKAFMSVNQDRTSHVFVVWGLRRQSLSSCHQTNITCHGHTVWDDTFNMNPPDSQRAVVGVLVDVDGWSVADILTQDARLLDADGQAKLYTGISKPVFQSLKSLRGVERKSSIISKEKFMNEDFASLALCIQAGLIEEPAV